MPRAILREVAPTYDRAIVPGGARAPEVALARVQHERYAEKLRTAEYQIEVVPADNDQPDCVFIEDTAVIVGSVAVACRPGAPSRRGEVEPVVKHLERTMPVVPIEAPGTIDGGDVMITGGTLYVGRSSRTNDEAIAQLEGVARSQGMSVRPIRVEEVLHLKSAVLPVDESTVVVTPGTIDESLLSGLRIVHEATEERHGFSALRLGTGEVLVTDTAPETAHSVADLGIPVIPIDISEIQAADGGLTCMSILIDDGPTQISALTTQ